jgi:hypothetical protein
MGGARRGAPSVISRVGEDLVAPKPATCRRCWEIGGEQNSTVVFPLPIDLLKPLLEPRQAPSRHDAAPLIHATATTG